VAERIDRLRTLSESVGRSHSPLEFGLRITTLIRDTTEQAWQDAEAKVATMPGRGGSDLGGHRRRAVGQQRLFDLAERGAVLDSCLYTTPAASVAAVRPPPGWSAPPMTWVRRCGTTASSA
jgi:alkanesulfonate monooxygenase